jgi:hypothetical protein
VIKAFRLIVQKARNSSNLFRLVLRALGIIRREGLNGIRIRLASTQETTNLWRLAQHSQHIRETL